MRRGALSPHDARYFMLRNMLIKNGSLTRSQSMAQTGFHSLLIHLSHHKYWNTDSIIVLITVHTLQNNYNIINTNHLSIPQLRTMSTFSSTAIKPTFILRINPLFHVTQLYHRVRNFTVISICRDHREPTARYGLEACISSLPILVIIVKYLWLLSATAIMSRGNSVSNFL